MGPVASQSIKNTITTYLGFGIGAINVLFLFTNFMSDAYFGLIQYIFSTSNIMMPLLAFGVHNTIVKFYSSFKTKQTQNSFLTLMLFLPLLVIVPLGALGRISFDTISAWLSKENEIIEDYIVVIYISAIAFSYFEVFYAWSKVHMQSVFGNFMKEIFHRICTSILLCCLYFSIVNVHQLILLLVGCYVLRMIIMALYAFSLRTPSLKYIKLDNVSDILKYSALIIIAGSVANMILEIDKFMIGSYIKIENVAYYSVAIYIASVIGVPARAMHQITSPLTAQLLNDKENIELKTLYKRSSLNLFIIGGFIFLLIVLNINQLYELIPNEYRGGLVVVILIGIAKLYDNLLGNNNAILFNSDYYRIVLFLGLCLVLLTILLNIYFIPRYGAIGACYATFIAVFIYNSSKLLFVKYLFKMTPFSVKTLKTLILLLCSSLLFYFWDFYFHPLINISLKSIFVGIIYAFVIYKLNLSEDISQLIKRYLKLK